MRRRWAAPPPSGTPPWAVVGPGGADEEAVRRNAGRGARGLDRDHVASVMADIAARRRSAIWELWAIADAPIRSRLRGELRRLDVRYNAHDLDGMVIDAVLEIANVARAWRPGVAPPWSWAHHRVVGVVHRFVGVFARSLDELGEIGAALHVAGPDGLSPPRSCGPASGGTNVADDPRAALRRLAATRPDARDLYAALSDLASPRDSAVWLAVLSERAIGNRHPAVTVAAQFGMSDASVRKVVQRVRARLAQAAVDGRYPTLAALPVVADAAAAA